MAENVVNTQENCFLIDWFSMTTKLDTVDDVKELLGMSDPAIPWIQIAGFNGYSYCLFYAGISICWGLPDLDCNGKQIVKTVLLNMSGSGCRSFETYSSHKDWEVIFALILADPQHDNYHLTRLDIAFDDWSGVLDINRLKKETDKLNLVTVFKSGNIQYDPFNKDDLCIYYGSNSSEILFRCYNKAAERNRDDISHWVRFEMQLRRERAENFLRSYHTSGHLGNTFLGVLTNYMRFVVPSKTDSNKRRWKTRPFWSDFIDSVERISLYSKKDDEYNMYKLQRYVIDMAGAAVFTYIMIRGIADFELNLQNRKRRSGLSKKYEQLIKSECNLKNVDRHVGDLDFASRCAELDRILTSSSSIQEALLRVEESGYC